MPAVIKKREGLTEVAAPLGSLEKNYSASVKNIKSSDFIIKNELN